MDLGLICAQLLPQLGRGSDAEPHSGLTAVVLMVGVVRSRLPLKAMAKAQRRWLQHYKPLRVAWWSAAAGWVTIVDTDAAMLQSC